MLQKWFYRLVLSYLPIVLFIVFMLTLVYSMVLSDLSRKAAIRANSIYTERVLQTVDTVLQDLDRAIVRETLYGENVQQFIRNGDEPSVHPYEVLSVLNQLKDRFPVVDSAYMIRFDDNLVTTNETITSLDRFGDRDYALQMKSDKNPYKWSGPRVYSEGAGMERSVVLTLVKAIPLFGGGMVVVNVSVEGVRSLLDEVAGTNFGYITLTDQDGRTIAFAGETGNEHAFEASVLSKVRSAYTGWEIVSGVRHVGLHQALSKPVYGYAALIVLSVLIGIGWILWASRRNYKPVENIVRRIDSYSLVSQKGSTNGKDEFDYIEQSIEQMIDHTNRYRERHEAEKATRRAAVFRDLMEGLDKPDNEEWQKKADDSGILPVLGQPLVIVVEVDGLSRFAKSYSIQDRSLLRYALRAGLEEMAANRDLCCWMEWLAPGRLSLLFELGMAARTHVDTYERMSVEQSVSKLDGYCGEALSWIANCLPFTATIAYGDVASGSAGIPASYNAALQRLNYKASLGGNRIIRAEDVAAAPMLDTFDQVQLIRPFVQSFKLGEAGWNSLADRFLDRFAEYRFTRDDLFSIANYALYYLHREMMELSGELSGLWAEKAIPRLTEVLKEAETLVELRARFMTILSEYAEQAAAIRERQSSREVMLRIRSYIEEHCGDLDMSLSMLGEMFRMNTSYLSRLFKETFGQSFVDYLIEVRMERAKVLLMETEKPVQDISRLSGYSTTIAFNRTFKKTTGMTPGEYRKQSGNASV